MYKFIFALAMLTGSLSSFAQGTYDSPSEGKVQTSMPEMKTSAASEQKWSAGLASGFNSPKGPSTSSAEYGLVVGFEPIAHMGAALEASTTHLDNANDVRQTNVLLRPTYVIGGDVPVLRNSYIGAGVGPVFVGNKVRWTGAPLVGFDIPLNSKPHDYLSLGLEAKYLFISNTDVPDLFASALSLKYWF